MSLSNKIVEIEHELNKTKVNKSKLELLKSKEYLSITELAVIEHKLEYLEGKIDGLQTTLNILY